MLTQYKVPMRSQVFGSAVAILKPFQAVISSEWSCCPWSCLKVHASHSRSCSVWPLTVFGELGRMNANMIARPMVATPSIKKSC